MQQLIPIVRFLDQLLMFVVTSGCQNVIVVVVEGVSYALCVRILSLNLKYCFCEELFNIFVNTLKFCGIWIIWIFWRLYLLIKYILLGINCDLLCDLSHDPFLIGIIIIITILFKKKKGSFFRVNSSQLNEQLYNLSLP